METRFIQVVIKYEWSPCTETAMGLVNNYGKRGGANKTGGWGRGTCVVLPLRKEGWEKFWPYRKGGGAQKDLG